MQTASVTLLDAASADGSGTAVHWPGGKGYFSVAGTFGSGTVKLEVLGPDGSTYFTESATTTKTAAGGGVFDLPPAKIRATITGSTNPVLYANASRIPY